MLPVHRNSEMSQRYETFDVTLILSVTAPASEATSEDSTLNPQVTMLLTINKEQATYVSPDRSKLEKFFAQ